MPKLYVGLVHYPIYNKRMDVIASAVTNFDIHDISRTCRTYDIAKYFIIHPLDVQRDIVNKILDYWQNGYGRTYNPDRSDALDRVCWQPDIEASVRFIEEAEGKRPYISQLMLEFIPILFPISSCVINCRKVIDLYCCFLVLVLVLRLKQ